MKTNTPGLAKDRRTFLKGAAAAGGATVVTVVAASNLIEPLTEPSDTTGAGQEQAATGYHETPHIKAFYRTLRS